MLPVLTAALLLSASAACAQEPNSTLFDGVGIETGAVQQRTVQVREAEPRFRWQASAFYRYQSLTDGRPSWHRTEALLLRRFRKGSVIVKGLRARRFDEWDEAVALEGYRDLWSGAYGHLRLQYAFSPQALAEAEVYAELFQSMGGGWEVAGTYWLRDYPGETLHLAGLGVGKYVGRWYLRAKTLLIPRASEVGVSQSLRARRYLGTSAREFLDVQAGLGRSVELVGPRPRVEIARTYFVTVRLQRFVTRHLGFSAGAAYSDVEFYARRGVTAGLLVRW
jgi:YaiO family outer membrane protein